VQLDPKFALPGRGFPREAFLYFNGEDTTRQSWRGSETCLGECAETGAELAESMLAWAIIILGAT